MPVAAYLDTLLLLLVVAAAINDLSTRRIPNLLLLSGLAGALALHALSPDPGPALLDALKGALTGLLVFLPFYLARGMAAGDVKMMATVGAFIGPGPALYVAILAWCAGGAMALAFLIYRRQLGLALTNMWSIVRPALLRLPAVPVEARASTGSMPYGLAIAAGTIYLLTGRYA
ncbi:pilus assembly-related outer membrane protein [Massilia varians]|uniref:Pilus assembly-related outer membrane protein n=1 Tax=Massilia varians TaxID=457921 RepID=A0ABM8C162_9BURK|nr:prepilin peptidase [Massilia varians]BDT56919.1 pilus assembly-related outer membrane protein [Massilia varians]